jgi:hypothetical protein
MVFKKIQCMVCYACFKDDLNDLEFDDPTLWNLDTYSKWCRNGYATYLAAMNPNAAVTPLPATSMTTAFVSTAQKEG